MVFCSLIPEALRYIYFKFRTLKTVNSEKYCTFQMDLAKKIGEDFDLIDVMETSLIWAPLRRIVEGADIALQLELI